MPSEPVTVLIVEDSKHQREALADQFARVPETVRLVGEARNAEQALMLVQEVAPDVVLLDLQIPWRDGALEQDVVEAGIDTLRQLHRDFPAVRVLVITWKNDPSILFDVLRFGAHGYLFKNADYDGDTLIRTIVRIANGEAVFGSGVASLIGRAFSGHDQNGDRWDLLTVRERQVLELIANGRSNAEIATQLVVSRKTVENHVSNVLRKLHVGGRGEASILAKFHSLE